MNDTYRRPEYWPPNENSEKKIYIESDIASVEDLKLRSRDMWPDCELENVVVGAENIKVHNLKQDRYDFADWVMFITLEHNPPEED